VRGSGLLRWGKSVCETWSQCLRKKKRQGYSPNDRKDKRRIDVDEETRHFIQIMEDQTIPPGNHRTSQAPMAQTITRDKQRRRRRKDPEIDKVENSDIVAQVEQKVMPGAFLVNVRSERQEVGGQDGIGDVDILRSETKEETGKEE